MQPDGKKRKNKKSQKGKEDDITYNVESREDLIKLISMSKLARDAIREGIFTICDDKVIVKHDKYVKIQNGVALDLTPYAKVHLSECCIGWYIYQQGIFNDNYMLAADYVCVIPDNEITHDFVQSYIREKVVLINNHAAIHEESRRMADSLYADQKEATKDNSSGFRLDIETYSKKYKIPYDILLRLDIPSEDIMGYEMGKFVPPTTIVEITNMMGMNNVDKEYFINKYTDRSLISDEGKVTQNHARDNIIVDGYLSNDFVKSERFVYFENKLCIAEKDNFEYVNGSWTLSEKVHNDLQGNCLRVYKCSKDEVESTKNHRNLELTYDLDKSWLSDFLEGKICISSEMNSRVLNRSVHSNLSQCAQELTNKYSMIENYKFERFSQIMAHLRKKYNCSNKDLVEKCNGFSPATVSRVNRGDLDSGECVTYSYMIFFLYQLSFIEVYEILNFAGVFSKHNKIKKEYSYSEYALGCKPYLKDKA